MVGTLLSIKPKTGVVVVVAVEVAVAIVVPVAVVAMGEVDRGLTPEQDTEVEAVMVAGREVIVAMMVIALVTGVVAVVTGVGADTVAVAVVAVLMLAIGGSDKACTSSLECLFSCLGSSVKRVGYAGRLFQIRVSFATPCSCEF